MVLTGALTLLLLGASASGAPADGWAAELHLGGAHDYGGWGDGRRLSTFEQGLFLEHRRDWLSLAFSGSVAEDFHRDAGDNRIGFRLHAAVRMGIDTPRFTLRVGPALSSGDRGERGVRTNIVALGNAELRYLWRKTFLLIEAGGRGSHATIGEGVHIGVGRKADDGFWLGRESVLSLYVASLAGVSLRQRRRICGDEWIFAGKLGFDFLQVALQEEDRWARGWNQGAFEFALTIGRAFDWRRSVDPALKAVDKPRGHVVTASLASIFQRSYAAEYEWTPRGSLGFFIEPAWLDRRTSASIRLSGPHLRLGRRFYPGGAAPQGFWLGTQVLLGAVRASGWDSLSGPLGPHTDSTGLALGAGVGAGFTRVTEGIVFSMGAAPEFLLTGFHDRTGRPLESPQFSLNLRLNVGRAF